MIRTSREHERGCGFRQPGGLYLMGKYQARACGGLPVPLVPCGMCGQQVKQARSFTWIEPGSLFEAMRFAAPMPDRVACLAAWESALQQTGGESPDWKCGLNHCGDCNVSNPPARGALIWVGRQHYELPGAFVAEACSMGLSRRIGPHLPHDFWNERAFTIEGRWREGDEGEWRDLEVFDVQARHVAGARMMALRQLNATGKRSYEYDLTAVEQTPATAPVVYVAHPDACGDEQPGVFTAFVPSAVERVVEPGTVDSDLQVRADAEKGIESVVVEEIE